MDENFIKTLRDLVLFSLSREMKIKRKRKQEGKQLNVDLTKSYTEENVKKNPLSSPSHFLYAFSL